MKKPAPSAEPPKRGRGRPRKIHSAPPLGALPRIDVPLDEPSGLGLMAYSSIFSSAGKSRVTLQDAVRELAAAYYEDTDVQRAVHSWRERRV